MASSSIRQPEDVLVSVASPAGAGRELGRCERGVEALGGGARAEHAQRRRRRPTRGGRGGADQDEAARRPRAARTSLRLDARPQGRRRLDLVRGAPRERDRPLLLGEPVGKLRGRCDSRLERGTPLRRERPVRERRQLGDLPIAGLVFSTASHRHGTAKGNAERVTSWRRKTRPRGARHTCLKRDLAVPTLVPRESAQPRGELG